MNALKIAWRNIWRNGKRTGITVAAIALNTAILIASYALMQGMMVDMLDNATRLVAGDAQVHAEGYRLDRSMYKDIPYPKAVLEAARARDIQAAARSYGFGLVSSGPKSSGASFWGVDPEVEQKAFELAGEIFQGRYLDEQPSNQVVLGRKLARSLRAEVGSEIVAVVQAADGSLGNDLFTVSGILKTVGEEIDRGAAILHRADFERLFVSGGRVHEIALNAWGRMEPERVAEIAGQAHRQAREAHAGEADNVRPVVVETWRELMPQLANMVDIFDAAVFIFGMFFFLAAGLGVMNTMLMATYERVREFGVLKAIGATPWRIMRGVSLEAFVLGLVSTAIGVVVGAAAGLYFQAYGIDLRIFGTGNMTFSGIAFDPIWRAAISQKVIVLPVVTMWVMCVLASLYPAGKAARLDPARAMTHV